MMPCTEKERVHDSNSFVVPREQVLRFATRSGPANMTELSRLYDPQMFPTFNERGDSPKSRVEGVLSSRFCSAAMGNVQVQLG